MGGWHSGNGVGRSAGFFSMRGVASDLIYFLHIPKTSGTSVHQVLQRVYGGKAASPPLLWDHLLARGYLINARTKVVTGHFGGLLPLWIKSLPRVITMLREPLARALSHINHVQRELQHPLHHLARGLSIVEYCGHPVLRRTVANFQSRYLASWSFSAALLQASREDALAKGDASVRFESALYDLDENYGLCDAAIRALNGFDAVGLCESHQASMQLFGAVLRWRAGVIRAPQLNTRASGQPDLQRLSAQELAALRGLNGVDEAVYRHACTLFADACRRRGVGLDADVRAAA